MGTMSTHDTAVGFASTAAAPLWGEQQLVGELRLGSVEAFNYLISLYHQPLYRFLTRLLGDREDAADALQEIFLKVFRSAARFEGKSSLKTWIYQIAVHEASNHRRWWRRHKRQETSLDAAPAARPGDRALLADRIPDQRESPLELALINEQRRQLQQILAQVPEPFHAVLVLREVEGFSYDEIAEILQLRIGTVKSRLLRGREMLRGFWQERAR